MLPLSLNSSEILGIAGVEGNGQREISRSNNRYPRLLNLDRSIT